MPAWVTILAVIVTLLPQVSQEIILIIQEIQTSAAPPTQDQMHKLAAYSAALGGLQALIDYHANS